VNFKWSDHQRKLHQVMVDPDRAITIATDFGSIMDMTAACVDNQHIPQRMIRAIYFIYRAHTRLEYIDYDDEEKVKDFISVRCDEIHYLGKPVKSESTGKKPGGDSSEDKTGGKAQDTCFHVACLHDIITSNEKTRELKKDEDGKVLTFLYNIWTDGCGGQYKNRKCFYFTAAINDIFPGRYLRIAHYLAVKFRFKGPWDADGRVDKAFAKKRALEKDHCQEALDFLRKIRDSKYQFIKPRLWFDVEGGGDDEFCKWIDAQDSRITKNKRHVVNTRKYTFGCDQVGLYEKLEKEFRDDMIRVRERVARDKEETSLICNTLLVLRVNANFFTRFSRVKFNFLKLPMK